MFSHFTEKDHLFFMTLAYFQKESSHDLRTQTGAVIVNRDKKHIASGTNKLPFPINHKSLKMFQDEKFLDYFNTTYKLDEENRVKLDDFRTPRQMQEFFNQKPYKYTVMQHAERQAIANAAKNGKSTKNSIMYSVLYPCVPCVNAIIDAGIKLLVVPEGPNYNDPIWGQQWGLDWKTVEKFLKLAEVKTLILNKQKQ